MCFWVCWPSAVVEDAFAMVRVYLVWRPWPNGQGVGLPIRRSRVRVSQRGYPPRRIIEPAVTRRDRQLGDSSPCGQSPMDFESITLATRSNCHSNFRRTHCKRPYSLGQTVTATFAERTASACKTLVTTRHVDPQDSGQVLGLSPPRWKGAPPGNASQGHTEARTGHLEKHVISRLRTMCLPFFCIRQLLLLPLCVH